MQIFGHLSIFNIKIGQSNVKTNNYLITDRRIIFMIDYFSNTAFKNEFMHEFNYFLTILVV